MLGLVEVGEVLRVFSELGVVFLLFWVGLETRLSEMRAVGRVAVTVGSAGVVLPFLAGIGLGLALGESTETSVFLGAALAATSAGITSATFLDLGIARTRAARTVLGAAVVDDILALILLSVAVGMAADGGVDAGKIVLALAVAVAFVAFVALGGTRLLQSRPRLLEAPRFAESPLLPAVILCLGLAAFSAQIGLAALIGAFLAGMIVAETKDQHLDRGGSAAALRLLPALLLRLHRHRARPRRAVRRPRPAAAGGDHGAGRSSTKLVPAYLAARGLGRDEAAIVGVGMVPRGEVGIVVASIGAAEGVVDAELFAVVVGMSVLTTLLAPFALRRLSRG